METLARVNQLIFHQGNGTLIILLLQRVTTERFKRASTNGKIKSIYCPQPFFFIQDRWVLEKLQYFTYIYMCVCVCACTCTCVGRVLEEFTTAGFLMNEGIRIADVEYGAKK